MSAELQLSWNGDPTCFGCGAENERGLQLTFRRTSDKAVECEYVAPGHYCGAPTVLHGGIQATILDEAMGKAVHIAFHDRPEVRIVTADFSLRYRRPVPIGERLRARAEIVRVEGPNVFVRGALLDGEGNELTLAEARWRALGERS
ncbi:MAG: PaaI family thioesterase [Dehalococcoidia bacterium]|nr:PaaI family thioesterase [Dehalococcoidia bacterium]MCL4232633.1 PaaI family thioesterase [Dehalococcoidia bacterium]